MLKKLKLLIALAYISLGFIMVFMLQNLALPNNQKLLLGIVLICYGIFRLVRAFV